VRFRLRILKLLNGWLAVRPAVYFLLLVALSRASLADGIMCPRLA
jgi:hypothetical protein